MKLNFNLMTVPTQEEYGAQPPIELLRQWFDNRCWCGLSVRYLNFGKMAPS